MINYSKEKASERKEKRISLEKTVKRLEILLLTDSSEILLEQYYSIAIIIISSTDSSEILLEQYYSITIIIISSIIFCRQHEICSMSPKLSMRSCKKTVVDKKKGSICFHFSEGKIHQWDFIVIYHFLIENTKYEFVAIKNNLLPCSPALSLHYREQTPVKLHCTFGGGFLKIFQSLRGHLFKMRDFKERSFSE